MSCQRTLVATVWLLFAGCASSVGGMTDATRVEADRAVSVVLDDWHDAAADADEERYFGHFAPEGVFLGTDATERWDVAAFREYAHPHFDAGRAWTFRPIRREVTLARNGDVAWFDEDLDSESLGPLRGSGVLVRGEGGRWLIAQYKLTVTIPNDRFGAVRELLTGE